MPWAGVSATCSVFGNSLDDGYNTTALEYTPMALAAAMDLPLGAWDNLGISGQTTSGMALNVAREVHPIAAATGRLHGDGSMTRLRIVDEANTNTLSCPMVDRTICCAA